MKRGAVVTIAISGDFGKPRPALVVQADAFEEMPSVTVAPMTSEIHDEHLVRITATPTEANGLRAVSQVMVDKLLTVARARVGTTIGNMEADVLRAVDVALARFLGLT